MNSEDLRNAGDEEMAIIVLGIIQDNYTRREQIKHHPGQLSQILAYQLTPIWQGIDVRDGMIHEGGASRIFCPPEEKPPKLVEGYWRAVELLRQRRDIIPDPDQRSDDFVVPGHRRQA